MCVLSLRILFMGLCLHVCDDLRSTYFGVGVARLHIIYSRMCTSASCFCATTRLQWGMANAATGRRLVPARSLIIYSCVYDIYYVNCVWALRAFATLVFIPSIRAWLLVTVLAYSGRVWARPSSLIMALYLIMPAKSRDSWAEQLHFVRLSEVKAAFIINSIQPLKTRNPNSVNISNNIHILRI